MDTNSNNDSTYNPTNNYKPHSIPDNDSKGNGDAGGYKTNNKQDESDDNKSHGDESNNNSYDSGDNTQYISFPPTAFPTDQKLPLVTRDHPMSDSINNKKNASPLTYNLCRNIHVCLSNVEVNKLKAPELDSSLPSTSKHGVAWCG